MTVKLEVDEEPLQQTLRELRAIADDPATPPSVVRFLVTCPFLKGPGLVDGETIAAGADHLILRLKPSEWFANLVTALRAAKE